MCKQDIVWDIVTEIENDITDLDTICEALSEALDIDRDERGRLTRELPFHTLNALTTMLSDTRRALNGRWERLFDIVKAERGYGAAPSVPSLTDLVGEERAKRILADETAAAERRAKT